MSFTISSSNTGLLPPIKTTAQRTAISSPPSGLVVYDSDLNQLYVYNGAWNALYAGVPSTASTFQARCGSTSSPWTATGSWTTDAGRTYSSTLNDTLELTATTIAVGSYLWQINIDTGPSRGTADIAIDTGGGSYTTYFTGLDFDAGDVYGQTITIPFIVTTASATIKIKVTVKTNTEVIVCYGMWTVVKTA